ncbi:hypothetical protein [Orlajensenia flava]|nr:hypothetical protein [Glaciibacter flavus]
MSPFELYELSTSSAIQAAFSVGALDPSNTNTIGTFGVIHTDRP